MTPRCLAFGYWADGFSRQIGLRPDLLLNTGRAELAEYALGLPAARAGGELLYPDLPEQTAALMTQFLRLNIVRFGRYEAAKWTAEQFVELNAFALEIAEADKDHYEELLVGIVAETESEESLAQFLSERLAPIGLLSQETEALMVFVGVPVEPDRPPDISGVTDLFEIVERAARIEAKTLTPPIDLFAPYPAVEAPADAWNGTRSMLWGSDTGLQPGGLYTGGMIILDVEGGSSALGQELMLAGPRRPTLWLVREGEDPPSLVAGYAKEADVRLRAFADDNDLAEHVAEFVRDKGHRMAEMARERRHASLLNLGPQLRLRRKWMNLSNAEQSRVAAIVQMPIRMLFRTLLDCHAFDQFRTADLRRLANALGMTLSEVYGAELPARLSLSEEKALATMAEEDGLSASEALRLRRRGEARLARPNALLSLGGPDGWRRLYGYGRTS